jgi:aldehyde:ferredoxin oxidoreductase
MNTVVEKKEFEKLKNDYYQYRGWDAASGLQTKATMKKLQLEDIAADLDKRGLLV